MTDKNKPNTNTTSGRSTVALNEDRGLSPASSGTPMPKVKPAAPSGTTQSNPQNKK